MNDFSKQVIKALKSKKISIYSRTWLPSKNGDFCNGETGYLVNDNGVSRVLTYLEVIKASGV